MLKAMQLPATGGRSTTEMAAMAARLAEALPNTIAVDWRPEGGPIGTAAAAKEVAGRLHEHRRRLSRAGSAGGVKFAADVSAAQEASARSSGWRRLSALPQTLLRLPIGTESPSGERSTPASQSRGSRGSTASSKSATGRHSAVGQGGNIHIGGSGLSPRGPSKEVDAPQRGWGGAKLNVTSL